MKEIKNGMYCNLLPVMLSKTEIVEKLGLDGNERFTYYSVSEGGYVSDDGAVILVTNRSPYIGMLMETRKCTDEEKEKWVRYVCGLFNIDLNDYIDETQENAWADFFERLKNPTTNSEPEENSSIIPSDPVLAQAVPQPPIAKTTANTGDTNDTTPVQQTAAPTSTAPEVKINTTREPNILGDTKGLPNDVWLEWRAHGPQGDIPYTLGGSDIAAVFGVSPWKTPLELWLEKHGDKPRTEPDNPDQLEMGHLLEPIVAHFFGKKTGLSYYEDTNFYQHPDYEWALANVDRRYYTKDGEDAVLECKSTSFHKRDDWGDDKYPYYYELQVRFYMAVLNINHGSFACLWGNNPENDFKYPSIERDLEIEKLILEVCQDFIDSLYAGVPPTMEGVKTKTALEALKRIYEKGDASLPAVEFGKKHGVVIEKLAELDAKIKAKETELAALEEQRDEYKVKIIEAMKENEVGTYTADDGVIYTVKYPTRSRTGIDTKRLKAEAPDIYKEYAKTTYSRSFSIKTTDPTT